MTLSLPVKHTIIRKHTDYMSSIIDGRFMISIMIGEPFTPFDPIDTWSFHAFVSALYPIMTWFYELKVQFLVVLSKINK